MRKFDLCKRIMAVMLACFITLSAFTCITFAQTTDGVVVETVDDTTGGDDWGDTVPDEGGGGDNIPDEDLGEIPDDGGDTGDQEGGDLEDDTGGSDDKDKIDYTTAVGVKTAEELEQALANKEPLIRIDANFNLDRTFYIISDTIIFSEEAHTLLRSVDFGKDVFVVGENADGTATENAVSLNLGKPDSSEEDLLTIDGNKENMAVDVVGSVIFVLKGSTANLYSGLTITNCKKVGNEKTLLGTYGVSYPIRVGGAVAILAEKSYMNIFGGFYFNNGINETSDDELTCIQGGAIYNFGTLKIYGGTFNANRSVHGGAFFNYRKLYIYNGTISDNYAESLGGAIYVPNSTGAFLYIGQENDVVDSDVTFSGNTADDGGAIYARNILTIENATFANNTTSGYGGAIVAYTPKITVDNSVFYNNKASYGGAIYVSGNNNAYDEEELNITNTIFESNIATSYGGALAVVSEARLYATKVDFVGNSSKYAGAVYTSNGSVEIDEATFTDNSTTSHGAAMGLYEGAKALLNNITAYGNTAGGSGGFAVNTGADLTIYNSSIFDNSSKNIGGAIYYTTDASGAIYATSFKNNTAKGNAGAVGVYTGGTKVLMHSCTFENNVSSAFGGAIFVSGKSILDLYNITAVKNNGNYGGFMYETAASTVVTAIGITVSENTATTGGNTIWGNTNNAKLYIDISKYVDLSYDGDWDEDYWSSAVANLLKVYEISEDLPSYIDYKTGEEISPPAPSVTANISSASQLERALKAKLGKINLTADITVDRTFYVTSSVTIFSEEGHALIRATDFGGDIFVVGESADGKFVSGATLKLGDPDADEQGVLTIDGNKDNMTVDVVGSAIFVVKNSTVDLYESVTIKNCKKVGNERTLLGTYGVSYPVRVGGAVAIVSEKANVNIYGGTYTDNAVNETSDDQLTCIQGGAIYNFGTLKIYGGTFSGNRSVHGGVLFNYRKTYIYNATISGNHAESLGGAIYVPNSTGAFLYVGGENEIVESAVTFEDNSADSDGGVIYARNYLSLKNATFKNNTSKGEGGAIIAYSLRMFVENTLFEGNTSATSGGALYVEGSNSREDVLELNLTATTFKNNTASSYGGAIYLMEARAKAVITDFIGNSAKYTGAVYCTNANLEINGATVEDNKATSNAGAFGLYEESTALLNNISADGNSGSNGGFAYVNASNLDIYNSTINNNTASGTHGGAIYYATDASGGVYATKFEGNHSANQGGAISVYTGGTSVLLHSCNFESNIAEGFGGAVFVSGKSILDMYNNLGTNNKGSHGGFMYETAASTVVKCIGLTVSGNSATTGGNIIWGNTLNAKLYINKAKYLDKDFSGSLNDAYWASAIANKLTVIEISDEAPKYLDYGNESYEHMKDAVDVGSAEQLEKALALGTPHIRIVADFVIDRTFYVASNTTIFSTIERTLTRADDFAGDIFIVGETENGSILNEVGTVKLSLGNPLSIKEDLLTIDGNRDNMTVPVHGTVIFVSSGSKVDLHPNVTIINALKTANEHILTDTHKISSAYKAGGAVSIIASGTLSIYGGKYKNNSSNVELGVTEEGKSDYTSTMGGAFYNYSNLTIYDGIFENNHSYSGGFLYNYCNLIIYGGSIIGNHSAKNGGAIYNANTSISHAFIGTDADSSSSNVLFENNTCDINGGAIYSPLLSVLNLYGNTTFRGNEIFSGHGGAIYVNGSFNARDTVFENNIAISRGGAIYNNKNHRTYDTRIVSITDCTFINNTAASGGAILLYASAADYPEGSIVSITGCRFENNHATSSGGAIYSDRKSQLTIINTTFEGNHAEGQGGTLYAQGESVVHISDSTIKFSTANSHGGAIALHSAYLDLTNTDILGSTSSSNGGAIYISYSSSSEMNSKVNIENCNIKESISHSYGGAIYITRHSVENEHRILTLKNSELGSNTAQYGGGAIYSASKVDAYFKDVDFIGNSTIGEGSDGGAIYAKGSYLTFDTVTFTENFAMQLAGVVYMDSGAVVVMNNIIASNNTADGSGGFLYNNGSELKVYDSTISENYSSVNGGAIAFYDDSVSKIYNTLFEKNYSVENGGAIVVYTGGTECMLHSCSFNGNTSENFGGAMYVSGSGLLNLYNITADGNTALKGGMLYETTTGTSVTINGIAVKGNTATDSGNIIFGNSTGAVLNLNKSNYIDYDKGELDAEYWETLVANKLTVNYVTGSIPNAETYKGESETKPKDPIVKEPVLVDDVLSLGISSSDENINSTYNALPRLDNSSNFMSKKTTKFPNINGETVTVDSLVYPAKSKADNPNCSQGLLIYQAILYKQAHPEEDVYIDAASYRFSVQAAVNINRNSRYFGYMRDLGDREYDKYGFVRISYLLITAAKMGINVTVIGHRDGYPVSAKALNLTDYFTTKLNDPCDPNYVENGVIGDYLDFHYIKWTLGQNKGGTDMMHTKLCAVSHYLDMNGKVHKNTVYTSSSNLDGINSSGINGNWKLQTGSIISDHEGIYRASVNYLTLIAAYEEQGEIYEFQDIVNKRSTAQVDLILEGKENEIPRDEQIVYVGSETDNVFELYFTPLGGGRLAWEDKYNPYCKYIRKMYNSEDYIGFVWNAAEYNGKYTLGLQMERMITEAFHKNRNVKNSIYTIMESFDSTVFDDLKVGVDIGYKSFNKHDFGEIHNKDLLFSYVEGGERYFVSLLNSTNIHGGSMSYQSNFALVIKETDGCSENSVFYTMAENTSSGSITEHYYGETKRQEPTETEDGYTYKECKGCGKQEKINVIHKEGEWIVDRVPTASLRGIKHKECENCGVLIRSSELLYEQEASADISDINGKTFDETKESLINVDVSEVPLTFEATIQLDTSITERAGVIVGNYASESEPQINFEIYHSGKPRLYYVDSHKGKVDCLFDTDIRSSKPKNVAITIDGNTARLYVDGKLKETKTLDIAIESGSTGGFKVGGDNRSGNMSHFKGTIYSLNMFNEVRSESQIAKDRIFVVDNPSSLIYSSRFSERKSNSYFATELLPVGKTFSIAQSSTINRSFDAAPRTLEAVVLLPESTSSGTIVGNIGEKDASTINLEVAKDAKPQLTIISDSGEKCVSTFETNIAIGTPTHIAVTLEDDTATLYVNGVKVETVAVSVPLPENAADGYHIGGDARKGNTNYFTGTIYSVNMFSDLRTSTEIKHDISAVLPTADALLYSGHFVNEGTVIEGKTFTENVLFSVADDFEQTPKTIEAIIQVPKSISDRAGVIIGNYANVNSINVLNVEIMTNGKPRLFFINEKGEKVSHIFGEDIRSSKKKHIAITVDGTTATLYVDGVKSESATLSATLPQNATENFKIGGDNRYNNTQYFQSIIYSVNLFSDVRTSEEIAKDATASSKNTDALMYSKVFTKVENTLSSVTGKTFDQKEINKINSTFEKAPKTIEAYVNVPKELEGRAGAIIGNYTNGTSKNVINLEVLEYGKVRLFTIDGKYKRNDCVFNVDIRSDSPVHIAVTANEKQATLYVNGVKAETATLTTVLPEALEGFVIGGDNRQNNAQYFKGTIYSVNLFGDVRTQEEVLKDFASVSADEDELLYSNNFLAENQVTTMLAGKTFNKEIEETVGESFAATPKTIEAVIQLSKDITTRGGVIVGNYKSATDTNVFNLEVIESGKLRLFFINEKGEKSNTGFKTDVRSDNPSHIAVTISGKTATLYLNGKECETISFPYLPPVNATKNLVIGGDNRSGNTQYFKGTIYSVNMFNDVRSASDIATDVMFVDGSDEKVIFSRYYMNTIGLTPIANGEGKRFTNTTLNTVDSALAKTPATFEATIKLPKTFDDRAGVIVGNYGVSSGAQINLEVYTHGRIRLYYTVGTQKIACLFKTDIRSSKPVHIAVTVEGKLATLYVNGKKAESVSLSQALPSNAMAGYCIGGDNRKGNSQYFKGTIYSVNLYSSVRTAAEILNSAANGTVESDTLLYSNVFDSLSCAKNTSGSDHEAGEWIIDYNATETEKGVKHLECTLCGKTLKVSEVGKMALGDNCYDISGGLTPTTVLNKTGTLSAAPKTFEMTVQLPPSFSDRAGVIIGNYTGGNENQINIEVYTNGQLRLYCKTGGNAVSYVFKTDIRSIDPVHIAITTSGLKANLYINGVYKETVNMYRALPSATEKFCIGGDNRSGNIQYFKGIIHSVNIFSDERTAEEIAYDAKLVTSDTEGLVYSKYY